MFFIHVTTRGHKVLMFSQMARMLDIIQDYLGYRGYYYTVQVVQSLHHNAIQRIDYE